MTEENTGRYLWLSVVLFITYLFLGSYLMSKDILELIYLGILYMFLIYISLVKRKNRKCEE